MPAMNCKRNMRNALPDAKTAFHNTIAKNKTSCAVGASETWHGRLRGDRGTKAWLAYKTGETEWTDVRGGRQRGWRFACLIHLLTLPCSILATISCDSAAISSYGNAASFCLALFPSEQRRDG